ncbi:VOC family protein [Aureimonas flava]|uniref:VOC family protein n=1 Tax=Aureimonas flava TaxID=2320271 RepID=A0A3A1WNT6_9HYPH|nr:VOC family protein [Aureimonas flava]RIX97422.1 VOC family protein [Aureimonas flava]
MANVLGIDHPLIAVRDIDTMRERYAALGFRMTPVGRHPWGTSTSLAIFRDCLIELMGVYDETLIDEKALEGFSFGRAVRDDLKAREGISLCALHSDDAEKDVATLSARGVACQGTIAFGRDVTLPDGQADRTATTLKILASDDLPRLSNFACQQHRRDLVEVPAWMDHPNGCTGYAGVAILAEREDWPRVRARLAALYGKTALFETADGFGAQTDNGVFTVLDRAAAAKRYGPIPPEIAGDLGPCYLAMEIAAPDLARVKSFLEHEACRDEGERIVLTDAPRFGNVFLAFVTSAKTA